ncbi:MAG: dihydropteroate synthase [Williamsia sp.]|nr:dihydropteroate synthase [Williamsia sp.]
MFTLNCKGRLWVIDRPQVMGIINMTPDSFYAGSRFSGTDAVLQQAERMLTEGASFLDIGAQSTRPKSRRLDPAEETARLIEPLHAICQRFPEALISVDTYHAAVAQSAVEAGASLVNDISGGSFDRDMINTVATLGVPFVCMHVKGTAENMHHNPQYGDVTREVLDYFIVKTAECKLAGIHDVIIDPGFGFSKNAGHNFELIKNLSAFKMLDKPLLAGISRKSTIYKTLLVTPAEALNGTTVLNTICLLNGANILRVHDVKEAIDAVKLVSAYQSA